MSAINPAGLYCVYLRKSRKDMELEALGHGDTLARHAQALADLASRLGIRIARTYREVVSGDTIADRPEVQRLLEDVNAGRWDGVLAMDVDRLGRGDSIDQGVIMQSFYYSNTLIITPDKIFNPADEADAEFMEIKLFFARREYKMIKKRMQRGRIASVMDGCWISPRAPYGYERVRLTDRKGWTLKPVPEKAEIVRSVFRWYADGMDGVTVGANTISKRLNDMGLKTDLGNPWTPSSVKVMLHSPVYVGMVQWNQRQESVRIENGIRVKSRPISDNGILVKGRHEPILDRALFDRVQAMLNGHAKRPKNAMSPFANPFAGLVVCPCCGHHMQRKDSVRGDFLYCPTPYCATASAYIAAVEDAVLDVLAAWKDEFSIAPQPPAGPDSAATDAARQQLSAQREALSARLSRHYDLLEQGVYSVDEFKLRRADVQAQIADIDAALGALDQAPAPDPRAALIPQITTVLGSYRSTTDPETKNNLLRSVIDRIIYHKTQRNMRNNKPGDNLSLEVYPRLPDSVI